MRVGQRAQEHAVRHAEHGSGTADAESKREHREQGIHGTPPEDTNRIPAVLRQLFPALPSPDRPRSLLHESNIAELQQGLTTRLFGRQSAIEVVARFALDVVADVMVERLQHPPAARHDVIPARRGRRIRPTAAASVSHLLVSISGCFRPFAVNREKLSRLLCAPAPSTYAMLP